VRLVAIQNAAIIAQGHNWRQQAFTLRTELGGGFGIPALSESPVTSRRLFQTAAIYNPSRTGGGSAESFMKRSLKSRRIDLPGRRVAFGLLVLCGEATAQDRRPAESWPKAAPEVIGLVPGKGASYCYGKCSLSALSCSAVQPSSDREQVASLRNSGGTE
jgi:hypothetical protein